MDYDSPKSTQDPRVPIGELKNYQETCAVREMTFVERLEGQRDRVIAELAIIQKKIDFAKQNPHLMDEAAKLFGIDTY